MRIPIILIVCCVGCNTLNVQRPLSLRGPKSAAAPVLPSKHSQRVAQFLFLSDFELSKQQPLFRELGDLRAQIYRDLRLPESNRIVQVYLFEGRESYERYMEYRYPGLPQRRAFFVAQPRNVGAEELLVYTYWGDRIREDLRHELTHALLHSVLKDVPIWLDEGLAEYFETPAGSHGINVQHLRQLRQGPFQPDLARLERLDKVKQMDSRAYCEAWAWVHLMLTGPDSARQALCDYLQDLRTNPKPGPLRPRLASAVPALDDRLAQHIARLPERPGRRAGR